MFPKPMPEKIRDQLNNGQLAVVPYEFCHHPELVGNEEKYIVNINQLSKVKLENLDKNNEINIVLQDGCSPHKLCAILPENIPLLEQMMEDLNDTYNCVPDKEMNLEYGHIQPNNVCVARYSIPGIPGLWHRCQILKVDMENYQVQLLYLDYGTISFASMDPLKYMTPEFAKLPLQCIYIKLDKVLPTDTHFLTGAPNWSTKGLEELLRALDNVHLLASVVDYDEEKAFITAWVSFFNESHKEIEVNKMFCAWGYGILDTSSPICTAYMGKGAKFNKLNALSKGRVHYRTKKSSQGKDEKSNTIQPVSNAAVKDTEAVPPPRTNGTNASPSFAELYPIPPNIKRMIDDIAKQITIVELED